MFDPVTDIKIQNNNKLPKMGLQQTPETLHIKHTTHKGNSSKCSYNKLMFFNILMHFIED